MLLGTSDRDRLGGHRPTIGEGFGYYSEVSSTLRHGAIAPGDRERDVFVQGSFRVTADG
jgi:hypothetical protein